MAAASDTVLLPRTPYTSIFPSPISNIVYYSTMLYKNVQ